MTLAIVPTDSGKSVLNLNWYRHQIRPEFNNLGLSDRYTLQICEDDRCVYAQNKGDPERKYVIGFANEFADKKMHVINDRLEYIARK